MDRRRFNISLNEILVWNVEHKKLNISTKRQHRKYEESVMLNLFWLIREWEGDFEVLEKNLPIIISLCNTMFVDGSVTKDDKAIEALIRRGAIKPAGSKN